jgi:isopenicillin-N N-acyltransferase-like protein
LAQKLKAPIYQVLEIRGSAYDRGFMYGEHNRALMRRLIDSHYNYYAKYLKTEKSDVLRDASKFAGPVKDFSETVFDELRGEADGAGIKLDEVLAIAAFNEVFYPRLAKACTSFAVRGGATADGLTYVGQNNDEGIDPWLDGECTTLTRYRQTDAPDALLYSYAGAPAMMGINSSGLAVCINALGYDAPRLGVPMLCVVREVMNRASVEDAVDVIGHANKAFALNFMIGSPKSIADVEANPTKTQVMRSDDALYHANHYLCATKGFNEGKSEEYATNSKFRCARMGSLINEHMKELSLDVLEGFLRDHENRPNTICAHVNHAKPEGHWSRTLDGMIYVPEKREAWIAKGNPCETEFMRYTV